MTGSGLGRALVAWFRRRARDLPWRRVRTPWSTWVSEVMLQQTTVEVVAPAFVRFLKRFPTPESLAAATEAEVVAAWAGLGYYRRARFLKRGAEAAVAAGGVPRTYADLRKLPGLGPYTAGAVASLAFGEAVPAVDGNVARVASRFAALDVDPLTPKGRAALDAVVLGLMPKTSAGEFNEALIELGAVVCRPVAPACDACPLAVACRARAEDRTADFPRKRARRTSVAVLSARAVVREEGRVLLARRSADASLLPDFEELPGRWLKAGESAEDVLAETLRALGARSVEVGEPLGEAPHAITHHRIRCRAYAVAVRWRARDERTTRFAPLRALGGRTVTTETRKLARAVFSRDAETMA